MKKYLLILPLLFLGSFGYAEGLPELPMDIHGTTDVNEGLVEMYASGNKVVVASIKEGKFGTTSATEQHILLSKFEGELSLKIIYDGKTYDTNITYSDCPKTFTSRVCRYDLSIIKDKSTTTNSVITENVNNAITKDTFKPVFKKATEVSNQVDESHQAYEFAYKNKITTQDSYYKANMNGTLTRAAMAKMLSYYAINVLGLKPDTSRHIYFDDVSYSLDEQYDYGISLAYQLGIMGINMEHFRPYDLVTRAEFGTALSRMLFNTKDGSPYYKPHLDKLKAEGILTNTDPDMLEIRGYVMLMLMRSFNNKSI